MISLYTLEATERLSDTYPVPALRVHAGTGCGRSFKDVAAILEPDSPNPCLVLSRPLGLSGVRAILAAYEADLNAKVRQMERQSDAWAAANPGRVMRAERWAESLKAGSRWGNVTFQRDYNGQGTDTQFYTDDGTGTALADPIDHPIAVAFKAGETIHCGIHPDDFNVSLEIENIGEYGCVWVHGLTLDDIEIS